MSQVQQALCLFSLFVYGTFKDTSFWERRRIHFYISIWIRGKSSVLSLVIDRNQKKRKHGEYIKTVLVKGYFFSFCVKRGTPSHHAELGLIKHPLPCISPLWGCYLHTSLPSPTQPLPPHHVARSRPPIRLHSQDALLAAPL